MHAACCINLFLQENTEAAHSLKQCSTTLSKLRIKRLVIIHNQSSQWIRTTWHFLIIRYSSQSKVKANSPTRFLLVLITTEAAGNIIAVFLSRSSLRGLLFPFFLSFFSYSNLTSTSMQEVKKFQLGRPEQNM